ncbi:MAG: hypothetical protein RLZZ210_1187 [Pseudomonadota bacterium]|jgi:enoyl-CoA hydratase
MINILDTNDYKCILANINHNVLHIRLNRPEAKNAINSVLASELKDILEFASGDDEIHTVLLDGGAKVFSVGADLKEVQTMTKELAIQNNFLSDWDSIAKFDKPIIACVNGYALGGGCELALMCDIIIAGSDASFAQPEVKVGLIPGAGGTQYLAKSVGKAQAMDICLSAKLITAFEAVNMGIISRVSEAENAFVEAMEVARTIASYPLTAVIEIKTQIKNSFNTSLQSGLESERQAFYNRLDNEDAKEGISAFIQKRAAVFSHK